MSTMDVHRAIGVFDSGIGGLTVLREIMRVLPHENAIYLGDTARVPYGIKSPETVRRYSLEAALYLQRQRIKLLVVACNTSSALSLNVLRRRLPIPVIGVIEPGARRAVEASRRKRIGVIGTEATIKSGAYKRAIERFGDIRVIQKACPLFVPLAEEGRTRDRIASLAASEYLRGFKRGNVDVLVLGCTHYPLLRGIIRKTMGNGIAIIDSAEEVAEETVRVLRGRGLLRDSSRPASYKFLVTDDPVRFKRLGSLFLGRPILRVKRISL